MEFEYIYVLQNKSLGAHHIKIGKTTRKPVIRAKELYYRASGVPEPFDVAFACQVTDCTEAESKIHERLKPYRSNKRREFFIIPIKIARRIVVDVCQQINQSSNCLIENPIVIDSQKLSQDGSLDKETENLEGDYCFAKLHDLIRSPSGLSTLNNDQKQRVEIISAIFSTVYPEDVEDWIINFSRDRSPETEISVWENIARAFLKIDQVKYLTKDQKKEAFYLLLGRSMMSTSKVLEQYKLLTLSKREAKEILREYEAKPIPLNVFRIEFSR